MRAKHSASCSQPSEPIRARSLGLESALRLPVYLSAQSKWTDVSPPGDAWCEKQASAAFVHKTCMPESSQPC